MPPNFIKRIPIKGAPPGTTEDCIVMDVGLPELRDWHEQIQLPFITNVPLTAGQAPALDREWHWPARYLLAMATNRPLGRVTDAFQLLVSSPTSAREFVVVGQAMLVHGYAHPGERSESSTFVWYLAGTPQNALNAFGVQRQYAVLPLLLDTAIQKSLEWGYGGRIALHADNKGTPKQQADLISRYGRCGLMQMKHLKGTYLSIGRPRIDDQYFTHSVQTAAIEVANWDHLR